MHFFLFCMILCFIKPKLQNLFKFESFQNSALPASKVQLYQQEVGWPVSVYFLAINGHAVSNKKSECSEILTYVSPKPTTPHTTHTFNTSNLSAPQISSIFASRECRQYTPRSEQFIPLSRCLKKEKQQKQKLEVGIFDIL